MCKPHPIELREHFAFVDEGNRPCGDARCLPVSPRFVNNMVIMNARGLCETHCQK